MARVIYCKDIRGGGGIEVLTNGLNDWLARIASENPKVISVETVMALDNPIVPIGIRVWVERESR